MSHSADVKRAYGLVTAVGTAVGERAKADPAVLEQVRGTQSLEELTRILGELVEGSKSAAVLPLFLPLLTEEEWKVWRARILLQAKMVRDDGKPAPGHERRGL